MVLSRFAFTFAIITGALAVGYLIQQLVNRGRLRLPIDLKSLRILLQKWALLFFLPITVMSAIWIVSFPSMTMAALPLFGFAALTLGGVAGLALARLLKLPPRQTGALFPCGSFTNIGAIGALVCYLFLGEKGFALVPIYKIFEELTYYGIGFPIAKYYSTAGQSTEGTGDRLKALARDPFILTAVSALIIGGLLNASGLQRPAVFATVNAIFIPLGTSLLLISIGLAMKFKSVRHYLKACVGIAAIKFVLVPVVMTSLAFAVGYGRIENGLPLKVVMILTSMPVAFNALIPPSIYDLDLDLANACWFFTTMGLVVVLPVLLLVLNTL